MDGQVVDLHPGGSVVDHRHVAPEHHLTGRDLPGLHLGGQIHLLPRADLERELVARRLRDDPGRGGTDGVADQLERRHGRRGALALAGGDPGDDAAQEERPAHPEAGALQCQPGDERPHGAVRHRDGQAGHGTRDQDRTDANQRRFAALAGAGEDDGGERPCDGFDRDHEPRRERRDGEEFRQKEGPVDGERNGGRRQRRDHQEAGPPGDGEAERRGWE